MKKYLLLLLPVIMLVFFTAGCEDTGTDPDPGPGTTTGGILLQSTPAGASIFVNNSNTNKTTPDSVTGLTAGNHSVTLRLTGYEDTTFTVQVTAGRLTSHPHVNLTPLADLAVYQPIRIYERASENLSGIDLSTGTRLGSGSAETDIYYEGLVGNSRVIRSQHLRNPAPVSLRTTRFYSTNSSNITDGVNAPNYQNTTASWVFEKFDDGNYSFIYDQDNHYSKLLVIDSGQDGQFDRWVEVNIIYNRTQNDPRF
jgi:hypothetical protein